MALYCGIDLHSNNSMDTAGRARGLSGAPQGARGLAAPYRAVSVLIPMGG